MNKLIKKRLSVVLICILLVLTITGCSLSNSNGKSLYDLVVEQGFEGNVEDWLNSLDEKTASVIRSSYVSDVNDGYEGNLIDWVSENKNAYITKKGKIKVTTIDGEKVVIGKANELVNSDKETKENNKTTKITASNKTVEKGQNSVEIGVSINNNPGILGMTLSISYDEKALKLVEAQEGDAFKNILTLTKAKLYKPGCKFLWDGVEIDKNQIKDGEILKLTFKIKEGAKKGKYSVSVTPIKGSVVDNNLNNVDIDYCDGIITLK